MRPGQPTGPLGPLEIQPLHGPLDAVVTLPGSKSITNRALLVAALAQGPSLLRGVLDAEDTAAMLDCLRRLGVQLSTRADTVSIEGCGGRWPVGEASLDARQAGTVGRFLPAALALGEGRFRLDGAAQLRERPLGPLVEALRQLGAEVHEEGAPGCLPIEVVGHGPTPLGSEVALAADVSSQFVSGLMLAGPLLPSGLRIRLTSDVVSRPYLMMTAAVMAAFGAEAMVGDELIVVGPGRYQPRDYRIEPDASAASYVFAAAALCGGRVVVPGLGRASLQGDTGFVALLGEMGAVVDIGEDRSEVRSPEDGLLRGVEADLADLSDTAPTLAAVAPFALGQTRATGIGFIRRKESDRIGAVLGELAKLGVAGEAEADGWLSATALPTPARSPPMTTIGSPCPSPWSACAHPAWWSSTPSAWPRPSPGSGRCSTSCEPRCRIGWRWWPWTGPPAPASRPCPGAWPPGWASAISTPAPCTGR